MQYLINKSYKIWDSNRVEEGVTILDSTYKVFRGTTLSGSGFQFTKYPTDNCQFASIGSGQNILHSSEAINILKDIYAIMGGRPMFMFDLKGEYINKLKELFPESDIVMESPYISTNGSSMTLFLVKTTILK